MSKRKNKIFINPQKSFTLIEMLVVIAIIGILAGIVLVAVGATRSKARDSRIISEMGQLRNAVDLFYNNNNNSYTGPPDLGCGITNPNVDVLCDDIALQGGKKPSDDSAGLDIIISAQAYCAEVKLNSGKYWCIDSVGISKLYPGNPSCVGGGTPNYTCE